MPYPVYPQDMFHEVRELPGRTGTPYSTTGERQYTRRWLVRTKTKGLASIVVCTAPTIPRPGSFYISNNGLYDASPATYTEEFDTNALLSQLSATENVTDDDWGEYVVTATYSTRTPTGGGALVPGSRLHPESRDNPTLEWPDIRWGSEQIEVVRYTDLDGNPFVTSAGQQIAEAAARMRRVSCSTLTISRNEQAFDSLLAEKFAFVLNDRPFLGRKKWAVQCLPATAEAKWRGSFQFWRVTYTLRFFPAWVYDRSKIGGFRLQPRTTPGTVESEAYIQSYLNTWQPLVLDAGTEEYRRRAGVDSARGSVNITAQWRTPIYVRNSPVSGPVLLNGEGQQLRPEDEPLMRPYYVPFRQYPDTDLTLLLERGFA